MSVAASTKATASMMPPAIERKAGEGTSITADRLTRTVAPDRATALPAVSMVSTTASTVLRARPIRAPRKRMTMNRA